MKQRKKLLPIGSIAILCLLLSACAKTVQDVTVTLVNQSGHAISSISITPASSDEWNTEYVDGIFLSGDTMEVQLGAYPEDALPAAWNILVYNEEAYVLYDTNVDEIDFSLHDGEYIVLLPPEETTPVVICTPAEYEALYAE